MSEIEALAEKLTDNQRRAVIFARLIYGKRWIVEFTDPWTVPVAHFYSATHDELNDLGLALRDHLLGRKG